MKLTITSIHLKSPLHFFALSYNAMRILSQLQKSNSLKVKKKGFWKKHYTMSLWESAEDMEKFKTSGAHLEAMKRSGAIASEIYTLTIDSDNLIEWNLALPLLYEKGRKLTFK